MLMGGPDGGESFCAQKNKTESIRTRKQASGRLIVVLNVISVPSLLFPLCLWLFNNMFVSLPDSFSSLSQLFFLTQAHVKSANREVPTHHSSYGCCPHAASPLPGPCSASIATPFCTIAGTSAGSKRL